MLANKAQSVYFGFIKIAQTGKHILSQFNKYVLEIPLSFQ